MVTVEKCKCSFLGITLIWKIFPNAVSSLKQKEVKHNLYKQHCKKIFLLNFEKKMTTETANTAPPVFCQENESKHTQLGYPGVGSIKTPDLHPNTNLCISHIQTSCKRILNFPITQKHIKNQIRANRVNFKRAISVFIMPFQSSVSF